MKPPLPDMGTKTSRPMQPPPGSPLVFHSLCWSFAKGRSFCLRYAQLVCVIVPVSRTLSGFACPYRRSEPSVVAHSQILLKLLPNLLAMLAEEQSSSPPGRAGGPLENSAAPQSMAPQKPEGRRPDLT
jgi:hypothetical protein